MTSSVVQSKEAAQYQECPNGAEHCARCLHVIEPAGANLRCRVVSGVVSPDGWCRWYEAEAEGEEPGA
jgi:hypothetical protein